MFVFDFVGLLGGELGASGVGKGHEGASGMAHPAGTSLPEIELRTDPAGTSLPEIALRTDPAGTGPPEIEPRTGADMPLDQYRIRSAGVNGCDAARLVDGGEGGQAGSTGAGMEHAAARMLDPHGPGPVDPHGPGHCCLRGQ